MYSKRNETGSLGKSPTQGRERYNSEKRVSVGAMGDVRPDTNKAKSPQSGDEIRDVELKAKNDENTVEGQCWLEHEVKVPQSAVKTTEKWLKILRDAFKLKVAYEDFVSSLFLCLDDADLPPWTILHMVASCIEHDEEATNEDPTIAYWLIKGFEEYVNSDLIPIPFEVNSNDIKTAAFFVTFCQEDIRVQDTIIAIFKLENDSELFVPLIKNEIETRHYDVAYDAVTRLKLQSHFSPQETLPMLLLDDLQMLDQYSDGDTDLQKRLVSYLDQFCVTNTRAEPLIQALNISNKQKWQLKPGRVSKVLKEFVRKFNIPRECCPNLGFMRRNDALFSVLYKKYVKGIVADEAFNMFVKKFIGNSKSFQRKLVFGMARHDDVVGAAHFAAKFHVSMDMLPDKVKAVLENGVEGGRSGLESSVRDGPRMDRKGQEPVRVELGTNRKGQGASDKGEGQVRDRPGTGQRGQGQAARRRKPRIERDGSERHQGSQRTAVNRREPRAEHDGSEKDQRKREVVQDRPGTDQKGSTAKPDKERVRQKRRSSKQHWLEHSVEVPSKVIDMSKEWFPLLENVFEKDKVYTNFCDKLDECLAKAESVWWTILHLIASSPDYTRAVTTRDSIISFLARGFRDYLAKVDAKTIGSPSDDARLGAFLVAFHQMHETVFETIFDTFHLAENPELFLPSIRDEIKMRYYDIAARAAMELKLQSHFKPEEILFQLYLVKDYHGVILYVTDDETQQQQLVQFLDQFYVKESASKALIERYKVEDSRKALLSLDSIYRSVKRYAQRFTVSKKYWPKVGRVHDKETLDFILSKKYKYSLISDVDFDDYVAETVRGSTDLQEKLVCGMSQNGDVEGAAYFAVNYKVPLDRVPENVRIAVESGKYDRNLPVMPQCDEILFQWRNQSVSSEMPRRYVPDELSPRFVFSPRSFQVEMEDIIKFPKDAVVAIDCEWKPIFDFERQRLSLLQVATKDEIIVVDILKMESRLEERHWSAFRNLLASENILKLGYAFTKDFLILANTSPILKDLSQTTKNFIDMFTLCKNVLNERPDMFPYYGGTMPNKRNLEVFVQLCFDRTLDNIQQFSNWERRPLNPYQLIYAEIDAYCLVDMYRVLLTSAQKMGLDIMSFTAKTSFKKDIERKKQVKPNKT